MKLPKYVFILPNKSAPDMGAGFILKTTSPHELGRVIKLYPEPFFEIHYKNEFKPLVCAPVEGYSVLIAYAGNLSPGYRVFVKDANWENDLKIIFSEMAEYFMTEKINNNLNFYKRYKL